MFFISSRANAKPPARVQNEKHSPRSARVAVRADVFVEAVAERADIETVIQEETGGDVQAHVRGEVVLIVEAARGSVVLAAADQVEPGE